MSYDDFITTEPVPHPDDCEDCQLGICDNCLDVDCQREPEPPEQDEPDYCFDCGLLATRCVCGVGEYEAWKSYQVDMEAA